MCGENDALNVSPSCDSFFQVQVVREWMILDGIEK